MKLTWAIYKNEGTHGDCKKKGLSGEVGCWQYMPDTWKGNSKKYIGYVAPPLLKGNQLYATALYMDELIKKGYTDHQIGLIYNGGEAVAKACFTCKVKYNSGAYAAKLVQLLALNN